MWTLCRFLDLCVDKMSRDFRLGAKGIQLCHNRKTKKNKINKNRDFSVAFLVDFLHGLREDRVWIFRFLCGLNVSQIFMGISNFATIEQPRRFFVH